MCLVAKDFSFPACISWGREVCLCRLACVFVWRFFRICLILMKVDDGEHKSHVTSGYLCCSTDVLLFLLSLHWKPCSLNSCDSIDPDSLTSLNFFSFFTSLVSERPHYLRCSFVRGVLNHCLSPCGLLPVMR